jgi:phosphoribosyl 1,2-cyclic phosphate phosphodiesterase
MNRSQGHFLFLGTGASMGIPVIGCHCSVCQSDSPCNKRMRPSGLITIDNKKFLIDCGPDFRMQALEHHIDRLDGLILTHAHHDHTAGIDELRALYLRQKIPLPC